MVCFKPLRRVILLAIVFVGNSFVYGMDTEPQGDKKLVLKKRSSAVKKQLAEGYKEENFNLAVKTEADLFNICPQDEIKSKGEIVAIPKPQHVDGKENKIEVMDKSPLQDREKRKKREKSKSGLGDCFSTKDTF